MQNTTVNMNNLTLGTEDTWTGNMPDLEAVNAMNSQEDPQVHVINGVSFLKALKKDQDRHLKLAPFCVSAQGSLWSVKRTYPPANILEFEQSALPVTAIAESFSDALGLALLRFVKVESAHP